MSAITPPMAVLAELTHRCPLQCPYCSNPIKLERAGSELNTQEWLQAISQAAEIGCLQIHFSGGEPTARRDLKELVAGATKNKLYTNLITSGVLLDVRRIEHLVEAGLEHVQLSFQDSEPLGGNLIGGYSGGHEKKLEVARLIASAGLPITFNFVVHRANLSHVKAMIDLAVVSRAHRVEIAHVQYYGWALKNRAALMPTLAQVIDANETVAAAREQLKGVIVIDCVLPDYYANRPKPCVGGWGRQFLTITPSGNVLPCHAAATIPDLEFDNVRERHLGDIWRDSDAFNRFRGTAWMPEPCRSCERAEIDWGGCRCQAFALTGDAAKTDPACALSNDHNHLRALAEAQSSTSDSSFVYRNFSAAATPDRGFTTAEGSNPVTRT